MSRALRGSTANSFIPPTIAITEPEACRWHTTIMYIHFRNYARHVEIITRIFHSLKQSSLEENFNAPTALEIKCVCGEVGVCSSSIKRSPFFISDSIRSACFNCKIRYIPTWALDIKYQLAINVRPERLSLFRCEFDISFKNFDFNILRVFSYHWKKLS